MVDESRFATESLEALLVSIADGVRDAQDALSGTPPLDSFGRPMPTYHLPYLDFKIEVEMETISKDGRPSFLRMKPRGTGGTVTREVSSTISGRLVAIPPGDGLPTPILTIASIRKPARQHEIIITAMNSAGEILAGLGIELNINLQASARLTELEVINFPNSLAGTNVVDAVLVTDENGAATTMFNIAASLPAKVVMVLTAELGSEVVHLTIPVGVRG